MGDYKFQGCGEIESSRHAKQLDSDCNMRIFFFLVENQLVCRGNPQGKSR